MARAINNGSSDAFVEVVEGESVHVGGKWFDRRGEVICVAEDV